MIKTSEFRYDLSIKELFPKNAIYSAISKNYPEIIDILTNSEITEKIDGIKITLWRNDKPFSENYQDNWVVAYKNKVLYPFEFDQISTKEAYLSKGFNQYALIFKHFEKLDVNALEQIPPNTEFFVEFSINKKTLLARNKIKKMFLIGVAKSKGEVIGGYLQTTPNEILDQETANLYRQHLQLSNLPKVDLIYEMLQTEFFGSKNINRHTLFDYVGIADVLDFITFDLKSDVAMHPEGLVLKHKSGIYKISNTGQFDKTIRLTNKQKYKYPDELQEMVYWGKVNKIATENITGSSLKEQLLNLRKNVGKSKLKHKYKTPELVFDDVYITGREKILRSLTENKNALFVGRFQPLTKMHSKIIKMASEKHHKVFVAIVSGSKLSVANPFDYEMRKKLIEALDISNVVVVESKTGNIRQLVNNIPCGISTVYAGSDRVESYQHQLKTSDISVVEIPRTDNISATQVRETLHNNSKNLFQNLTDARTHKFYKELKEKLIDF